MTKFSMTIYKVNPYTLVQTEICDFESNTLQDLQKQADEKMKNMFTKDNQIIQQYSCIWKHQNDKTPFVICEKWLSKNPKENKEYDMFGQWNYQNINR